MTPIGQMTKIVPWTVRPFSLRGGKRDGLCLLPRRTPGVSNRVCLRIFAFLMLLLAILASGTEILAQALVQTLRVEALIDGRSRLILHGNTAQWFHLDFAAPGRHDFQNQPTVINSVQWFPVWPDSPNAENRDCHCFSDIFTGIDPPLPEVERVVNLRPIQSRSSTRIVQAPTVANDFTTIVEFDDRGPGASSLYIVEIDFTTCGDGVQEDAEQCDDGNLVNNDACKADCTLNICGDGVVNTGVEQCDDGDTMAGDGCDAQCVLEEYGMTDTLRVEALIDGRSQLILHENTAQWFHLDFAAPGRHEHQNQPTVINGMQWFPVWPDRPDAENRNCHCFSDIFTGVDPPLPEDRVVVLRPIQSRSSTRVVQVPTVANDFTTIVEFDDNGAGGSDLYIVEIDFTTCGNGVQEDTEQCDDGNLANNDACRADCAPNICGDDFVNTGVEQCDDGHAMAGDGCDEHCVLEERSVMETVSAGTPVTTDTSGQGATPSQPVQAAVTPSVDGTVTITTSGDTSAAPEGFQILTGITHITAPDGTADDPLVLVFRLDASILPVDTDPLTILVTKDGVAVPSCQGAAGMADPDPCVANREVLSDGDLQITVFSSTASDWGLFGWDVCGQMPQTGCRRSTQADASTLQLKDNLKNAQDSFLWQWNKGAATTLSDFGDPTTDTAYGLCVYDATGLQLRAVAPAAGTCGTKLCWKATATGFTYTDKDETPEGVSNVLLKAGTAGKATLKVQGKGVDVAMPSLPLTLPLTVQLQASNGQCWEAEYEADGVMKNDASQFKAKGE